MNYLAVSTVAVGLSALLAAPLQAQNVSANNLVNVTLSDSLIEDVANDLNVEVGQIPVTVQAPIGIAANVCGVDANVLATQDDAPVECDASSTSQAFNNLIQRQIDGG